MLNNLEFDLWADNYDKTVQVSEENNHYPFAGYKEILNTIFNEVMQKRNSKVLDIGFGTGTLTSKLYENGQRIDGIDFSPKMISLAKSKMHSANLIEWDFSKGLPEELRLKKYDFIVSTYALHHLTDDFKVEFIKELLGLLNNNGTILIGDIAFKTRQHLEICKKKSREYWDDDEFYFVYEELKSLLNFCHVKFQPLSYCGGVFFISK